MTKRAYPFEVNVSRQLKFHINDHENDVNVLKSIQDQTIKKLVDGSKRLSSSETPTSGQMVITPTNGTPGPDKSKNFMQKCVTNYFTGSGKIKINNPGNKITRSLEAVSKCFFCENGINSTYKCVRCLEFYCASCSFMNYESLEDGRICISCS